MSKNVGAKKFFNFFIIVFPILFFVGLLILILIVRANNQNAVPSVNNSSSSSTQGNASSQGIAVGELNPAQSIFVSGYFNYEDQTVFEGERNVLFFHADWCPDCYQTNKNLISEKDNIPKNLAIYKLNYDTETELKQKYGVTYQHTFVQVDENGNMLKKWSGTYDLKSIESQLI